MSILLALQGAVSQGILWGVMVLGVYITYKLLDIADLTADGSFALGGCVCAVMVVGGHDPIVAILAATAAGIIAGAVTGFLHTVFEIPAILAGILTQIALWSINLRIMGKSNTPLLKLPTIFNNFVEMTGVRQSTASTIIGIIIACFIIILLYWFFGTELGSALRATGNNENMIRALGVNTKKMKMIALMLSNGSVRRPDLPEPEICGYRYGNRSHCDRSGVHRYRRGAWQADPGETSFLLKPSDLSGCRFGRLFPDPCGCTPDGHGRQ